MDQQNLNPDGDKGPSTANLSSPSSLRTERGETVFNEIDEDSGFFLLLLCDAQEPCTSHEQLELKEPFVAPFFPPPSSLLTSDKRSSFPDHQGSLRPRRDSLKERSFPFSFPESRSPTAANPIALFLWNRLPQFSVPLLLRFFLSPFYARNRASKTRHLSFLDVSTKEEGGKVRFLSWSIIEEIRPRFIADEV